MPAHVTILLGDIRVNHLDKIVVYDFQVPKDLETIMRLDRKLLVKVKLVDSRQR